MKLVGFSGKGVAPEIAKKAETFAYNFCLEFDTNLHKNKGKILPEKYNIFLQLAQWTKLAADIASRQCKLEEINKAIAERMEERPKLVAETEEQNIAARECSELINVSHDAIGSIEVLIDSVNILIRHSSNIRLKPKSRSSKKKYTD